MLALLPSARGTEDKAGDEEVDDGEEDDGEEVKVKEEEEDDEDEFEEECIDCAGAIVAVTAARLGCDGHVLSPPPPPNKGGCGGGDGPVRIEAIPPANEVE